MTTTNFGSSNDAKKNALTHSTFNIERQQFKDKIAQAPVRDLEAQKDPSQKNIELSKFAPSTKKRSTIYELHSLEEVVSDEHSPEENKNDPPTTND